MPIERRPAKPMPRGQVPENCTRHRVADGESWASLAERYGIDARTIIRVNFGTVVPEEVNWYLRHYVGCVKQTRDGKNWMFSKEANPGIIYVPPQRVELPPESIVVEADRLVFDGKSLTWFRAGQPYKSWSAVSGRKGYQHKKFQNVEDKGPLPEGTWAVRQRDYQEMPKMGLFDSAVAVAGRGPWPGAELAWGRHRVWLQPARETKTYGRRGFSIHGGSLPGSGGCIDLTRWMPTFASEFVKYGKDLELTVKYTEESASQ